MDKKESEREEALREEVISEIKCLIIEMWDAHDQAVQRSMAMEEMQLKIKGMKQRLDHLEKKTRLLNS